MTNIELIKCLKKSVFTDEDGEEYQLDFQAGLTDAELKELATHFPNNYMAPQIEEVLKETRGWEGYGVEQVDFSSIGQFGMTELAANGITLGHDGLGNFWVLDVLEDGSLGNVYYACHDPAVWIKYADDLNGFLQSLYELYTSPVENYLNRIHDTTVYEIWEQGGKLMEKKEFLNENKAYAAFLNLEEEGPCMVADLRKVKNGDGFAWGKFGAKTVVKRHPTDLVWKLTKSKSGFFARLFGM